MQARASSFLTRRDLDWTGLVASASMEVVIADRVGLDGAAGELLVRVHSGSLAGSGATSSSLTLRLESIGRCPSEPQTSFVGPTVAEVVIDADTLSAPALLRDDLTWPWGAEARLVLVMKQAATPGAEESSLRVSADLVLYGEEDACDCACR